MVFNHPSSVRRLWGVSDELIEAKHYLNVVAKYKKAESIRVVDIGCGRGKLLAKVAEYFQNSECVGLDQNELSVSIARNITGSRGRVELGGFERAKELGEFDVTICSEVFEHVLDTRELLDVLVEITRSGGA